MGLAVAGTMLGKVFFDQQKELANRLDAENRLEARVLAVEQTLGEVKTQFATAVQLRALEAEIERIDADQDARAFRAEVDALEEALARQLHRLEDRLGAMVLVPEIGTDTAAVARQVTGLAQTVANAQQRLGDSLDALVMIRMVQRIGANVSMGVGFQEELQVLEGLQLTGPEVSAGLAVLAPHAAEGLPTAADLAQQFEMATARAAQVVSQPSREGVVGKVLERVTSLVKVRRTALRDEGSPEAIVADIAFHLSRDNVRAAWDLAGTLPAETRELLGDWLENAAAVLAAHDAVTALERLADHRVSELATGS